MLEATLAARGGCWILSVRADVLAVHQARALSDLEVELFFSADFREVLDECELFDLLLLLLDFLLFALLLRGWLLLSAASMTPAVAA